MARLPNKHSILHNMTWMPVVKRLLYIQTGPWYLLRAGHLRNVGDRIHPHKQSSGALTQYPKIMMLQREVTVQHGLKANIVIVSLLTKNESLLIKSPVFVSVWLSCVSPNNF
jgi:hypothetical protein